MTTDNRTFDMTKGGTARLLLSFSLPMLVGNIFQQLYNMVDSMIVGNYVGANALAAVGTTGSLNFLFFSVCFGISAGIGIMTAQYLGAGDEEHVKKTMINAIYVIVGVALVMSILGVVFSRMILIFLNTPQVILEDAVIYMQTVSVGILAVAAYNGISSVLRALGDSKTPLYFLILACGINIGLDFLFVLTFHMGVFGVALATIISQAVSAIGSILYACIRNPYFRIPKDYRKPDIKIIRNCFRLGTPVALQNSMIAVSCVVLQSVVNGFGETVIAAFTATTRVEQLVQQPYTSLGMAVSTFTAQNMGAGQIDRIKKGYRVSVRIVAVFSLCLLPVVYFGGDAIMRMFVQEEAVIRFGSQALKITSCFYFFLGIIYVTRSVLNGAGDAFYSMINGIMEVVGRVGFSKVLILIPLIGVWGVWLTTALTWFITAVASYIRYKQGKWKKKSIITKIGENK